MYYSNNRPLFDPYYLNQSGGSNECGLKKKTEQTQSQMELQSQVQEMDDSWHALMHLLYKLEIVLENNTSDPTPSDPRDASDDVVGSNNKFMAYQKCKVSMSAVDTLLNFSTDEDMSHSLNECGRKIMLYDFVQWLGSRKYPIHGNTPDLYALAIVAMCSPKEAGFKYDEFEIPVPSNVIRVEAIRFDGNGHVMMLGHAQGTQRVRMEKFMKAGAWATLTSHSGNDSGTNRTVTMNIYHNDPSVHICKQFVVNDDLVAKGILRLEKLTNSLSAPTAAGGGAGDAGGAGGAGGATALIAGLKDWLTTLHDTQMNDKPSAPRGGMGETSETIVFTLLDEEKINKQGVDLAEVKKAYVKLYGGGPQTPFTEVRILQSSMIYDMLRWNNQSHEKAVSIGVKQLNTRTNNAEVWAFLGAKYSQIGLTYYNMWLYKLELNRWKYASAKFKIPGQDNIIHKLNEIRDGEDQSTVATYKVKLMNLMESLNDSNLKEVYVRMYGGSTNLSDQDFEHLLTRMWYDLLRWKGKSHADTVSIIQMKKKELKQLYASIQISFVLVMWVRLSAKFKQFKLTYQNFMNNDCKNNFKKLSDIPIYIINEQNLSDFEYSHIFDIDCTCTVLNQLSDQLVNQLSDQLPDQNMDDQINRFLNDETKYKAKIHIIKNSLDFKSKLKPFDGQIKFDKVTTLYGKNYLSSEFVELST